jgi:hypothetical protein
MLTKGHIQEEGDSNGEEKQAEQQGKPSPVPTLDHAQHDKECGHRHQKKDYA